MTETIVTIVNWYRTKTLSASGALTGSRSLGSEKESARSAPSGATPVHEGRLDFGSAASQGGVGVTPTCGIWVEVVIAGISWRRH